MPDKKPGTRRVTAVLPHGEVRSEYGMLRASLIYVVDDLEQQRSFGIEWIIRIFLIASQFLYPSALVRTIGGRFGFISRRVAVEIYVLVKLAFLAAVIWGGGYRYAVWVAITIYLLSETVLYLSSLIFLADIYAPPVSWRRSVLLLLINFFEITLAFAVMYLAANPLEQHLITPFHGVFFSFITSAGISYGNLAPQSELGQIIVLCHIIVMVIFLILLAQYVTNSFEALKAPSEIEKRKGEDTGPEG